MRITYWPRLALALARVFGFNDGRRRLAHEVRIRLDRFELEPTLPVPAPSSRSGWPSPDSTSLGPTRAAEAVERADRVAGGEHQAFEGEWRALPRTARAWYLNPVTGQAQGGPKDPWWNISQLSSAGDIKDVWEPGRFSWAYDLVRGHALTDHRRYRDFFFETLTGWSAANPPFRGPHWACGQETTIRAVALMFAEAGFEPLTDSERALIDRILFASGERVRDAIGYAVSQRNNHGISEATGLVVLGARFADRSEAAAGWLESGQRLLEQLIPKQFAVDGWYIQHSFNYLRVALHQCALAEWVLRARNRGLSRQSVQRLRGALRLLESVMTSQGGRVPHYGADDGANVLPIALAAHHDFRPVLSIGCALFGEPFPEGQDLSQEALDWLGLEPPAGITRSPDGVESGASGWAVGRVGRYQFFMRAGRNRPRPGQVDPLQVELWIDGAPAIIDPGTLSYRQPGHPPLGSFEAHNSPKVDGYVAAIPGPRFLALKWPTSRLLEASFTDGTATAVGEIPDVVRRTVHLSADGLEVIDQPLAPDTGMFVNWLLHPDSPATVTFDGGTRRIRGDDDGLPNWYAPTYGQRMTGRYYEGHLDPAGHRLVSRFAARPTD